MRRPDLHGPARRPALIAAAVSALLLAPAAPAAAETYCVGFARAGCVNDLTAADAFAAAAADADADRIELGEVAPEAALSDGGMPLDVAGSGEGITELRGGLTLSDPASRLLDATVAELALSGAARQVDVSGAAALRGTAVLEAALVRGGVDALDGTPRVASSVVGREAGPALRVRCGAGAAARLDARHVTLAGTPGALVQTDCEAAAARIADSILWAPAGVGFDGPGSMTTARTDYRAQAGRPDGPGDLHVEPGFAPGGLRLSAGSPMVDAGAPDPVGGQEGSEDRGGLPRVADGDGDAALARDLGAYELPPPAVALPAGNLIGDPSAERGAGWAFSGGFTRERYGAFALPTAAAGGALAAGDLFFSGGPSAAGSAAQRVLVVALAPEIDLGRATASLSGLLGGYRADADRGVLRAAFLGPAGQPLGAVRLASPDPAARGNATALLARSRSDPVPPLTRSILVTLEARRGPGGGTYDDAYFDNLGLTVTAPGAPAPPGPPPPGARPFPGLLVLAGRARLDRRGRVPVRIACADATVGRCTGVVTLFGALRRHGGPAVLAKAPIALRAGRARYARLRLDRGERRAIRRRGRIRLKLFTSARDGQGLTRVSTVPLTVRPRRR